MRRFEIIIALSLTAAALGQPATAPPAAANPAPAATRPAEPDKRSDAERIARLRRSIAESEKLLADLKVQLDDPKGEYHQAEAAFAELDAKLTNRRKDLLGAEQSGFKDEVQKLAEEVFGLEKGRQLAKERFDLAIQERKTLQEQIVTAEQKLAQDREALARLLAPPASQPAAAEARPRPADAAAAPVSTSGQTAASNAKPGVGAPTAARRPEPVGPPLPIPTLADDNAKKDLSKLIDNKPKPPSKELVAAQQDAQTKQLAAQEAEHEARSIEDRMAALRKSIDLERKLLDTTRKKADNAQETVRALGEALQRKSAARAPQTEMEEIWRKINQAQQRLNETRGEAQGRFARLDKLQDELNSLQAEQLAALREADQRRLEATSAEEKVAELVNPFAPRNLLRWLLDSGVKVAGILLGMLALLWGSKRFKRRLIALVSYGPGTGTQEDRENRAATLVGVFQSTAAVIIVVGGTLMILTELGVNIIPLMGTAAIAGLSIAFGAQNLIRDYFTGFMILLENQYGINDVVKLAGVSGQVERITLRITVLRDLEGVVHFIPNGQITTVSNTTHHWSRALFNIAVSYKDDIDRVMKVLVDLGKELRRDPEFRFLIMEDPEMLGVDALGDSAVIVTFFIKTRPLKAAPVKREMLRRIKNKFDELGIEIPFPQRTINVRSEDSAIPREPGSPLEKDLVS